MGVLVEAQGVCKRYAHGTTSVEVLRGVNLSVASGEMLSIVGPSGSGKSTLLYCLAGLERPDEGRIHIAGTDMAKLSRSALARLRARHVGFVFQQYNLVPSLPVIENVSLPARLAGKRLEREGVDGALARVGLFDRRDDRPFDLSGGEAQRVAIARAIAANPDIVFADEPTGALDTVNGGVVLDMLRSMARESGRTVVMVTHDLAAAALADRVLVMRDGLISCELIAPTPEDILAEMGMAVRTPSTGEGDGLR